MYIYEARHWLESIRICKKATAEPQTSPDKCGSCLDGSIPNAESENFEVEGLYSFLRLS